MPKTSLEKLWLGGALLVAFLVIVIGYFFFIGPQRDSTSSVNTQIADAQLQNTTLQSRIDALGAQNRKLSSYQAALAQARLALPATSDLPNFLRTLQSLGNATLADVTSLTVGSPAPATSLTPPSATAASPSPTTTSTTPAPVAGATSAPAGPAIYELPITAQVTGTMRQLSDFLGQLQSVQPRAVLVSSVAITGPANGSAGTTTLNITLKAFVAPGSVAETQQLAQAATK